MELPLASWARQLQPSAIQDMLQNITKPGILSLALGLPAAELFPTQGMAEAAARVLADQASALQYGASLLPLREQVVALMARRGVRCEPDQIFLTTGGQQGMSLLARLMLEPGQPVMMEDRIYSGFQQVLEPFQPRRVVVRTDPRTGIDVDAVEERLRAGEKPAFLYAMSDAHNPLGVSLAQRQRERLAALAREYRMPIIEDDAYGFLQYEEQSLAPIRGHEDRWVFYVGSFSKILAPALRVGWLVVPREMIPRLATMKESSDIDTTTFTMRMINAFLASGQFETHLERLRGAYRERRDAMLRALEAHMPRGTVWARPSAGMFVWVELPEGADTLKLLAKSLELEKVAYLPGQAFSVPGGRSAANGMRLNFSNCEPARIEEGVARLGRVLQRG